MKQVIARVSSQFPGAIRWREFQLDRLADGTVKLTEELHSTINHSAFTAECTPAIPIVADERHTTKCKICGGGTIGEGLGARETYYKDEHALLKSLSPRRGLPLELVFLAAQRDQDCTDALIDYLEVGLPAGN